MHQYKIEKYAHKINNTSDPNKRNIYKQKMDYYKTSQHDKLEYTIKDDDKLELKNIDCESLVIYIKIMKSATIMLNNVKAKRMTCISTTTYKDANNMNRLYEHTIQGKCNINAIELKGKYKMKDFTNTSKNRTYIHTQQEQTIRYLKHE